MESHEDMTVEETVGVSLLAALLQEIRLQVKPWEKLTKREQDATIDRLRDAVEYAVTDAVKRIAAKDRPTLAAIVDQVVFKDGVRATVKMNKDDPARHALADAQGQTVLLVVAGAKDDVANMDSIQGEQDQRAMSLGEEYADQ